MKIISWNVNGIRSVLKKGLIDIMKTLQPDILCIQETKAPAEPITVSWDGYHQSWNHAQKAGYSGTAIFSRIKPLSVRNDMGIKKHDQEGRMMTFELKDFYLINVYTPNSKRGLERLDYRSKEWDVDFLKYVKKIEKKKPVIFCGDLNVAHKEIDLSNPKGNEKNHGFTPEERSGFDNFMQAGFIDAFRVFNDKPGQYSWWSQMNNCRQRNIGWRIDYFCMSKSLKLKLKDAFILKDVMGSDHCPVGISLK